MCTKRKKHTEVFCENEQFIFYCRTPPFFFCLHLFTYIVPVGAENKRS